MIHADGGGYAPFEQSGYISKGYVDVFDIKYRQEMIADTRRLSEGKWPVKNRKGDLDMIIGLCIYDCQDDSGSLLACVLVEPIKAL